MAELLRSGTLSLEKIYHVSIASRIDEVEQVLDRLSRICSERDARIAMMRATANVIRGDVSGAIAVLNRAMKCSESTVNPYLIDLLVPLLLTRAQYDQAELVLNRAGDGVPDLVPPLLALRAVLSASRGDRQASRSLAMEAMARADEGDDEVLRARVLQRTSVVAYWLNDFAEAENRSLEAARLYESLFSFHHAAVAYSVLYSIAHLWLRNAARAQFYAERILANGRASRDASWERFGLVASLEIASESGDEPQVRSIQNVLELAPMHQQYFERFSIAQAETLALGWAGRFEQARSVLTGLRDTTHDFPTRMALCDALLGLLACADSDFVRARRLVRSAITRTGWPVRREPLPERYLGRTARIVAAASCIIMGDRTRGRRALSAAFDPSGAFARHLSPDGIDEERVAELDRGYARLINVVARAVSRNEPVCALTAAELLVLRQLPYGSTLATIASELGKSTETVKKQVKGVYVKLGVRNRTQAIRRASELGIL
jgi:ATP/maltotriose-dependent transcriptional regulator MalT